MLPQTPRARPPFASPTSNPSGPLGWGRGPDSMSSGAETYSRSGAETYSCTPPGPDQPAALEPHRSARNNPSLKENPSQRSGRLISGGRGVFPGQLDGLQSNDGARRGAPQQVRNRRADLRAARGREKCRQAAAVTNGLGLIALALALASSSNTRAGSPHRLQSKAQGMRGQLPCVFELLAFPAGSIDLGQSERAVIHRGDPPGVAQRIPQRRGVPVDNCPVRLPGNALTLGTRPMKPAASSVSQGGRRDPLSSEDRCRMTRKDARSQNGQEARNVITFLPAPGHGDRGRGLAFFGSGSGSGSGSCPPFSRAGWLRCRRQFSGLVGALVRLSRWVTRILVPAKTGGALDLARSFLGFSFQVEVLA